MYLGALVHFLTVLELLNFYFKLKKRFIIVWVVNSNYIGLDMNTLNFPPNSPELISFGTSRAGGGVRTAAETAENAMATERQGRWNLL